MTRPENGSQGSLAMRAFDSVPPAYRVRSLDDFVGKTEGQIADVVANHLGAAVKYFARHKDLSLREIGQVTDRLLARPSLTPNPLLLMMIPPTTGEGLLSLGMPPEGVESYGRDDTVAVGALERDGSKKIYLIMPLGFPVAAQDEERRVEALGGIAFTLSQVQSIIDGTMFDNPALAISRARAMMTHFFDLARTEPGAQLSERARGMWEEDFRRGEDGPGEGELDYTV